MFCDTYLPVIGGAEIHVKELSRAMVKLGYDVTVVTPMEGNPSRSEFPVIRLSNLKPGKLLRNIFKDPQGVFADLKRLARIIRDSDIIHGHYSYFISAMAVLIAKLYQKKSFVTLHGFGTLDSSVKKSLWNKLLRYISIRYANGIVATSEEMQDVAKRYTPLNKIHIISNGVDTDRFSPVSRRSGAAPVIVTIRRLAPKNGVQYLIEAAPRILKDLPGTKFLIAGSDKLEVYLKKRARELKLGSSVRFLGDIQHDKVKHYYSISDIVVFPSSAESTSLACLEAMSMKKIIVASALAPYKLMLGHHNERGFLVDLFGRESSDYNAPLTLSSEKINLLADTIIKTYKQRSKLFRKLETVRQFVIEEYDWRKIAKRTVELYNA